MVVTAHLLVLAGSDPSLVYLCLDDGAQIRFGQVTTLHFCGTLADDRTCDVFALNGFLPRVIGRGRFSILDGRQRRAERGNGNVVTGLQGYRQIATQASTHVSG